jgi:hypothetical protein
MSTELALSRLWRKCRVFWVPERVETRGQARVSRRERRSGLI